MRSLLDTSVLVAAMVESHDHHERALPVLQRVKEGVEQGVVAAHSIAELYAILTRLPLKPRISADEAQRLIQQNVLDSCEVIALMGDDYAAIVGQLATSRVIGGAVYDALILYTAFKVEVDRIVTLNESDFRRIFSDLAPKVVTP